MKKTPPLRWTSWPRHRRRPLSASGAACSPTAASSAFLIVAPVFYGVFYPQPYLGQLVRKIPIAVVDDDRT